MSLLYATGKMLGNQLVMKLRKLIAAEHCRACEDSGCTGNRLTKVSIKTNGPLLIAFLKKKERRRRFSHSLLANATKM